MVREGASAYWEGASYVAPMPATVGIVMAITISEGAIVQPISSGVLPWVCGGMSFSRPRLARYLSTAIVRKPWTPMRDDHGNPEDEDEEILLVLGNVSRRVERALRQRQLATGQEDDGHQNRQRPQQLSAFPHSDEPDQRRTSVVVLGAILAPARRQVPYRRRNIASLSVCLNLCQASQSAELPPIMAAWTFE